MHMPSEVQHQADRSPHPGSPDGADRVGASGPQALNYVSDAELFPESLDVMTSAPAGCSENGAGEIPNAINKLCPLFLPGVWADVVEFYQASAPIRVAVVDVDEDDGILGTVCGKQYRRWRHGDAAARQNNSDARPLPVEHTPYTSKFMAEVVVPEATKRTRYAVGGDSAATDIDVVLVSICVMAKGQQGAAISNIERALTEGQGGTAAAFIWKNRPQDVVAVVTSDHGPCSNFRESLGGKVKVSPKSAFLVWFVGYGGGPQRRYVLIANHVRVPLCTVFRLPQSTLYYGNHPDT
jgi:hypothetical protein